MRIAASGEQVAALGYDTERDDGSLMLMLFSADGQTVLGQRLLESGSVADFAWAGSRIYVARQRGQDQSLLETYDTQRALNTQGK